MEKEGELGKNEGEKMEKIGEFLRPIAPIRKKKRMIHQEWRNLKIRDSTAKQIERLSRLLDIKKYKIIDLSILILSLLLSEKIRIEQDMMPDELWECRIRSVADEERGEYYHELDPTCIIKKMILPYYRKKKAIEALIENIGKLSKI